MKIKTQFRTTMFLFSSVLTAALALIIITDNQAERTTRQEELAVGIAQRANELSYLSNDYLIYREDQHISRWQSRFDLLLKQTAGLNVETPEEQMLVRNINENSRRLKETFDGVLSAVPNLSKDRRGDFNLDFLKISSSRLAVQTQGLFSDAQRLSRLIHDRRKRLREIRTMLIYTLLGLFGLFVFTNYILTYRRTMKSMTTLQAGAKVIGSGDLDFRIKKERDDEIGEVSDAFNQMTAGLKTVTASRDELEKEIEERKRAEEAIRASEERFRVAQQLLPDGFSILRPVRNPGGRVVDFTWVYVNPALERIVGMALPALAGRTLLELFPGHRGSPFLEAYRQVAETGQTRVEESLYEGDGVLPQRWFRVAIVSMGQDIAVLSQDITERKQAEMEREELLRSIEEKSGQMEAILANMVEAVGIWSADGALVLVNDATVKLYGFETKEQMLKHLSEYADIKVWTLDGRELHQEEWPPSRALRGETFSNWWLKQEVPSRGLRFVGSNSGAPVRDANGKIVLAVTAVHSVTELYEAQEAVKQSRKTFADLIERSPFGTYVVDSQFRIAMMNASSQEGAFRNVRPIIGRPFDEVMRILWSEPVAAEIIGHFRHTLDTGEPYYSPRFINPRHDVEVVESYEWELHRMALPDGQYGVICYYYDSTKLRESEEALQESRALLQTVMDRLPDAVFLKDAQSRIIMANPATLRIIGKSLDEVIGKDDIAHYADPEVGRAIIENDRRVMESGATEVIEEVGLTPNGPRTFLSTKTPWRNAEGRVVGLLGITRDITERKQAEEALRKGEERLRLALRASQGGAWEVDLSTFESWWSPELYDLWGVPAGTPLTKDTTLGVIHEDDRERVMQVIQAAVAGSPYDVTFRIRHYTRGVRWMAAQGRLVATSETSTRLVGITFDVTDRKQAEEAFRESEERFRSMVEQAPLGVAVVDSLNAHFDVVNPALARMTGRTVEELQRTDWVAITHPDDIQGDLDQMAAMNAGKIPGFQMEKRYRRPDGSYFWVNITVAPMYVTEKTHPRHLLMVENINERKQVEAELERTRHLLAEGQRIAHLGSFEYIIATEETIWSDEEFRIYGLPPGPKSPSFEELVDRHFHPEDVAPLKEKFGAAIQNKAVYEIEHRIVRPDGSVRHLYNVAQPVLASDGTLLRYVGATLDITERKKSDEALRVSLREKEILLKEIHHRVKNNMQVISSLVALQAGQLQDDGMRAILDEVTHRVRSMALVHEKLYESSDLGQVEFAEYVRSLLSYLWRAHEAAASGIRLTMDLETVSLPVNAAVPCGLILNELIINALKHAFQGRDGGEVTVSIRGRLGGMRLSVRDDGVGLQEGFDWKQADSLGLRLVQMLAGQLKAEVEMNREGGTEFLITFGQEEPSKDQDENT